MALLLLLLQGFADDRDLFCRGCEGFGAYHARRLRATATAAAAAAAAAAGRHRKASAAPLTVPASPLAATAAATTAGAASPAPPHSDRPVLGAAHILPRPTGHAALAALAGVPGTVDCPLECTAREAYLADAVAAAAAAAGDGGGGHEGPQRKPRAGAAAAPAPAPPPPPPPLALPTSPSASSSAATASAPAAASDLYIRLRVNGLLLAPPLHAYATPDIVPPPLRAGWPGDVHRLSLIHI